MQASLVAQVDVERHAMQLAVPQVRLLRVPERGLRKCSVQDSTHQDPSQTNLRATHSRLLKWRMLNLGLAHGAVGAGVEAASVFEVHMLCKPVSCRATASQGHVSF